MRALPGLSTSAGPVRRFPIVWNRPSRTNTHHAPQTRWEAPKCESSGIGFTEVGRRRARELVRDEHVFLEPSRPVPPAEEAWAARVRARRRPLSQRTIGQALRGLTTARDSHRL